MKSLMLLWKRVANESATWCCTSATTDCKTVSRRVEHEGISFLTITLASFGKDFEKSLGLGYVAHDMFAGFSRHGGLPRFLGGFLERVFDRNSGVLIDDPCVDSIRAIRQLTLMNSKIALPCSDTRERAAMRGYIDCEQEVRFSDATRSELNQADFERIGALLFRNAFIEMDREIYRGDTLIPRHGPGATADKLRGNAKYRQTTWTRRLEEVFASSEYLLANHRYYDELQDVDLLEPRDEIPVKVISVPKTLKTPRIIGVEPTAMQYAQQSLLPLILHHLSKDTNLDKMLGFLDQTPNQRMAREGSLKGELATLDLSEASDRVSNQLVRSLFRHHKWLSTCVDACRSRKADVPGQGVVRLAKFASMGSALCFPVEAMVFLTIIFVGIERSLNTSLDRHTMKKYVDQVRVYGDDIIIPVDCATSVVEALEAFGSQVNLGKSFWTGRFRESCGREYYAGHDVSIVKVRQVPPERRRDATEVISMVSLRNQLYFAGYWQTVRWLDEEIRRKIGFFPTVLPTSPVLGRHSFLGYESEKIGQRLHNPLVKGYRVVARPPKDPLDGHGALLKFFLKRGGLPSVDEGHLERSGRPHAVDIKLGWASAV